MAQIPLSSYLDGTGWLPKGEYLFDDVARAYGLSKENLQKRIASLTRQGRWRYESHYIPCNRGGKRRFFRSHEIGELDRLFRDIRFNPELIPVPDDPELDRVDTGHFQDRYEQTFHRLELLRRFGEMGYIPSDVLEWIANTSRLRLHQIWRQQDRLRPDEGIRILGWRVAPFQELNGEFWWEIRPDNLPYAHRLQTVPLAEQPVQPDPDLTVEPNPIEEQLKQRAIDWLRRAGPENGLRTVDLSRRLSTPMPTIIDLMMALRQDGRVTSEPPDGDDGETLVWFAAWVPPEDRL